MSINCVSNVSQPAAPAQRLPCAALPQEIWHMVASHLEGSDLENLSAVSLKCQKAALRIKNEQENQNAMKNLKTLENLGSNELEVKTVIDFYRQILHEFADGTWELSDEEIQDNRNQLTKQLAKALTNLRSNVFKQIADNTTDFKKIEQSYLALKTDFVRQALLNIMLENEIVYMPFHREFILEEAASAGFVEIIETCLNKKGTLDIASIGRAVENAALKGHLEIVKTLLSDSWYIPQANRDLAAEYAVKAGHLQIFKELLNVADGPAFVNMDAFENAAKNGRLDILKYISMEVKFPDSYIKSIVLSAIQHGHLKIVTYFLGVGKFAPEIFSDALNLAAQQGQLDIVNYLCTFPNISDGLRFQALSSAAVNPHEDVMVALFKYKGWRKSALTFLAQQGRLDDVQMMLTYNDFDELERGYAAMCAAQQGHLEIVKTLLAHAPIHQHQRVHALTLAVQKGHLEIVKELLANGPIDDNARGKALLLAAESGDLEIVRVLLESGTVDEDTKERVLRHASASNHRKMADLLLTSIHDKDQILEDAAKKDRLELVKVLLASACICQESIENAICLAAERGYVNVVKEILATESISEEVKEQARDSAAVLDFTEAVAILS